jgi:transcriptional regulator with XRE-family HTH domain
VVWANDALFGCQFAKPLSQAVLSAAELMSMPDGSSLRAVVSNDQAIGVEPFGVRLRRLRKGRDISLAAFAKALGVSRPTVWAWESGKSVPRPARMATILTELGISDEQTVAFRHPVRSSPPTASNADSMALADFVERTKARIAELSGTTADKVRVIIEI